MIVQVMRLAKGVVAELVLRCEACTGRERRREREMARMPKGRDFA